VLSVGLLVLEIRVDFLSSEERLTLKRCIYEASDKYPEAGYGGPQLNFQIYLLVDQVCPVVY
jgi:hypothetical protein